MAHDRFLATLEQLLAIPAADLQTALTLACNAVAQATGADKVDAFLHDPARDSLVALGASTQPLSDLQKRTGLDILPIANGGRVVQVFTTGRVFVTGRLQDDPDEVRGIREALKIQSKIGVPLEVGGRRRGLILIASLRPDFFNDGDVRFAESVARWVGILAHRAELVQEIAKNAVEQGRRAVAEELVTILAHDLRNLLSPIRGRLELISRRTTSDLEATRRDAEAALRSVTRLSRVVADILDVARIDQGIFAIEAQPMDLSQVARAAAEAFSAPEHPVLLECPGEVVVSGDPARIRQVLENLIANAIQHSPKGAAVTVVVRNTNRENRPWGILEVRDEGPGIAADVVPRIFDRFAAGPRSTGIGLGLYLARRIVAAHGGELSVESQLGQGARFQLALPGHID